MKYLLFTCLLALSTSVFAQKTKLDPAHDPQNMKVVLNREPFYPAGEQALYNHILYSIKYPETAIKSHLEGEITASFNVKTDSTISHIVIMEGVDPAIDKEVVRLLKELKFAPSIQNGTMLDMSVMYTFPVKAH